MPQPTILLVSADPTLSAALEQAFAPLEMKLVAVQDTTRLRPKLGRRPCRIAMFETQKEWIKQLRRLQRSAVGIEPFIIAGPAVQLRQAAEVIKQIVNVLGDGATPPAKGRHRPHPDPGLGEFVETKLREFVKRMKAGGGKDLHALLLHEMEKPLIRLVLQETHWNQVKASHMLGLNRNTLRKKIRDLQIVRPPS